MTQQHATRWPDDEMTVTALLSYVLPQRNLSSSSRSSAVHHLLPNFCVSVCSREEVMDSRSSTSSLTSVFLSGGGGGGRHKVCTPPPPP